MFINFLLLIVGMVLLIKGADFFVEGSSGIAKRLGIPSLIIGLTLVSLGTSAPEISISINAVLSGSSDMSVGNVVGSNICNIFLILGFASLFTPLIFSGEIKKYDIPIMLGLFVVLILFSFVITPNAIHWYEGIILILMFIGYTIFLIFRSRKNITVEENTEENKKVNIFKCIVFVAVGLVAIIFGGNFVVNNAREIALKFGMSETLVSLTIVAVGTSLPELVTSAVAAFKKEGDIAIGNVIGSCVFNIVLILGLSAIVAPAGPALMLNINNAIMWDMLVMLVGGILLMLISIFSKKILRWQGIMFLIIYVAYIAYVIIRN
ncbi:MAG: calcium/sodium antiporter [Erysipelotrichaceae bacterium]|nr:calcium/sodium antiporter [Erysipelotrichaceae bacterium]